MKLLFIHFDVPSITSPYSPGGLYVNLATFHGFGAEHVSHDLRRNGGRLYVHLQYTETPKEDVTSEAPTAVPTKLAINVEGGFQANVQRYNVAMNHSLAVWTGSELVDIPLPNSEIPEFVSNICEAIVQHNGMRLRAQVGPIFPVR